jgi:4-hydroxybenzoyl-CoA reductase subunit beta
MLRMAPFVVEQPDSVDAAVALLDALHAAGRATKIVAGGTDVLPNIKHGLHAPDVVVHLGRLRALRGVRDEGDALAIGALTTLFDIEHDPIVGAHAPALAHAASLVAGPQLRRMGTLGGNLALDTRCAFYNQTHFWREALGYCLKKDGTACHVVAGGQRCVAAASNDTATILLCLDASVTLATPAGERTVALRDFFVGDGARNTILGPADVLVRVRVPKSSSSSSSSSSRRVRRVAAYQKLRHRNAIDFPLLSLGVRFDVDDDGVVHDVACVASALQARPHALPTSAFIGRVVDDAFADDLGDLAFRKCVPLTNIADDPAWRREMIPVLVKRACTDLRAQLDRRPP